MASSSLNSFASSQEEGEVVLSMRTANRIAGALSHFRDDASLPAASSMIRFRTTKTSSRVYPDEHGQFIITDDLDEIDGSRAITTKRINTNTMALRGLRATYTLVALFWVSLVQCYDRLHSLSNIFEASCICKIINNYKMITHRLLISVHTTEDWLSFRLLP